MVHDSFHSLFPKIGGKRREGGGWMEGGGEREKQPMFDFGCCFLLLLIE